MDDVRGRNGAGGVGVEGSGGKRAWMQDFQRAEPREFGGDILDEPAGEVVLGRIAGQIVERRNRNSRAHVPPSLALTPEGADSRP